MDHYSVLGLPRHADADAIRKAYHAAAKRCHPDRQHQHQRPRQQHAGRDDDEEDEDENAAAAAAAAAATAAAFLAVRAAYDTLGRDPARRAAYDAELTRRELLALMREDQDDTWQVENGAGAGGSAPVGAVDAGVDTHYELDLTEDMGFDEEEAAYVADCRCGDVLYVEEEDVQDKWEAQRRRATQSKAIKPPTIVIDCPGCSLSYRVFLTGDPAPPAAPAAPVAPAAPLPRMQQQQEHQQAANDGTVHAIFLQRASARPNDVAILSWQPATAATAAAASTSTPSRVERVTYGQLAERSAVMARGLRRAVFSLHQAPSSSLPPSEPVNPPQQLRIGTTVSQGPISVVLLLAIWRIGGVVVPLDCDDPPGRISQLAADAALDLLVVDEEDDGSNAGRRARLDAIAMAAATQGFCEDAQVGLGSMFVGVREVRDCGSSSSPPSPLLSTSAVLPRAVGPNDLSHIVFTSGSTGAPKGVLAEHRSLVAYGNAKACDQHIGAGSRVLLASAFTFDPFIGDVVTALCGSSDQDNSVETAPPLLGLAALAMAPRGHVLMRLGACLRVLHVTHICCTPPHWESLGETAGPRDFPDLQCVALGGEKMQPRLMSQWASGEETEDEEEEETKKKEVVVVANSSEFGKRRRPFRFLNTYGVTECAVYQTSSPCTPGSNPGVLGAPLPGVRMLLIKTGVVTETGETGKEEDEDSEHGSLLDHSVVIPASSTEVGEICLAGVQVARGYLNRPRLTRDRFVYVALKEGDGTPPLRVYRTGDLGRWWHSDRESKTAPTNCRLELLGRADRQVKVRGRRVELGEVEGVLSSAMGIATRNEAVPPMVTRAFVEWLPLTSRNAGDSGNTRDGDTVTRHVLVAGLILAPLLPDGAPPMASHPDGESKAGEVERQHCPPSSFRLNFRPLPTWRRAVLVAHCTAKLAPYMVPTHYFYVPSSDPGYVPQTRTGKIDRRAIADALGRSLHGVGADPCDGYGDRALVITDPVQRALASVWRATLGVSRPISPNDDFFSLGGDSLSALRAARTFAKHKVVGGEGLLEDITDAYGNVAHALAPGAMLKAPVLRDYAAVLTQAGVKVVAEKEDEGGELGGQKAGRADAMATETETQEAATVVAAPLDWRSMALRDAAEHGDLICVRVLLSLGADADSGVCRKSLGVSALHVAASAGHTQIVRALLSAGARVTVMTADRTTPVHIAAQRSTAALRVLLRIDAGGRDEAEVGEGADEKEVGGGDQDGKVSAMPRSRRCFGYLQLADKSGQTLLHHAARSGNVESVRLLVPLFREKAAWTLAKKQAKQGKGKAAPCGHSVGALDMRDRWQRTPLHWAVLNNHPEIVAVLLAGGALAQPYDPHKLTRLTNSMRRVTHLPLETPLALARRVHGEGSEMVAVLAAAEDAQAQRTRHQDSEHWRPNQGVQ